jgi:hypothetical protein
MFLTNGLNAILVKYNRGYSSYYDDTDKKEQRIKVCPYNHDQIVQFGIDTTSEGVGYFIVKSHIDVQEGDQLKFNNHTYTIQEVHDSWIWNKIANKIIKVK